MTARIRKADKQDLEDLREFLTRANLGTDGLTEENARDFLILEDKDGKINGSLGLEVFEGSGLLRSLVVSSSQAEKEIYLLLMHMLKLAREKGIGSLFLATNKSASLAFFEVLGFQRIKREDLPSEFYHSEHIYQIFSVDNSFFLKFTL